MSNRNYPYLSGKEKYKTDKKCSKCGSFKPGFKLTWQVSWFRGDDEVEKVCDDCIEKVIKDQQKKDQEREKRQLLEEKRKTEAAILIKLKLEKTYEVKYLTDYQWRVNNEIDFYVVNQRFHVLKTGKRGLYFDIFEFLNEFYKT